MKYFAFISFSSKDLRWGKRLQRKLESYRLPTSICKEYGWKKVPIKPVFFAPSDIQPGGLTEEIQKRLQESKNLIVVCSPNSAQSKWVGQEISYYYTTNQSIDNIHFFIVEGVPHSNEPETECFNPIVKDLGLPEILGSNIHESYSFWPWLNRERAYIQLISKLLGVEFDSLWNRHKRRFRKRFLAICGMLAIVILSFVLVWRATQPFSSSIELREQSIHNDDLPPITDIIVSLSVDGEIRTDTVRSLSERACFKDLPRRLFHKPNNLTIIGNGLLPMDTSILLQHRHQVAILRNPHQYGDIKFKVWDPYQEKSVADLPVVIDGVKMTTNRDGEISLFIPLEKQKESYRIDSGGVLKDTLVYPSAGKGYVLLVR